jgi:hypothetical protein
VCVTNQTLINHQPSTNQSINHHHRLSASLLRQATYTTTRFGCYMYLRDLLADSQGNLPFYQKARSTDF